MNRTDRLVHQFNSFGASARAISWAQNDLLRAECKSRAALVAVTHRRRPDEACIASDAGDVGDPGGQAGPQQYLEVTVGSDGEVGISVAGAPCLRFRSGAGGGQSWYTRNALLLLAQAIERDNAQAPQSEPVAMPTQAQCSHTGEG